MLRIGEFAKDQEVFYIRYCDSIESGKVVDWKARSFNGGEDKALIAKHDTWEVIECSKLFATRQEAVLQRAMELQQEASGKLSTAARLFKEAGVMKADPE